MTSDLPGEAPAPTSPPPASPPTDFFGRLRTFPVRPAEGRWGGGVAAALSRQSGLDVVLVRGLFVVAALMGGLGLLAYGIGWLLLPEPDGRIHLEGAVRGHVSAGLVGALVAIVVGAGGSQGDWGLWGAPTGLVVLAAIIGGIWWYSRRDQSPAAGGLPQHTPGDPATPATATWMPTTTAPLPYGTSAGSPYGSGSAPYGSGPGAPLSVPPARPDQARPSHAHTRAVLGLALVAVGGVLVWDRLDDSGIDHVGLLVVATALGALALGVLAAGLQGRRSGVLAPIAVVLALVVMAGGASTRADISGDNGLRGGLGQRVWAPSSAADAPNGYRLGVGEATLDLMDTALTAGATAADPVRITVDQGIGSLTVILPPNVATRVEATVDTGTLTWPDGSQSSDAGRGLGDDPVTRTVDAGTAAGPPVLIVSADLRVGELKIVDPTSQGALR